MVSLEFAAALAHSFKGTPLTSTFEKGSCLANSKHQSNIEKRYSVSLHQWFHSLTQIKKNRTRLSSVFCFSRLLNRSYEAP